MCVGDIYFLLLKLKKDITSNTNLFGSLIMVAFQNSFRVKIHQNDIFFILFLRSAHQNDPKHKKIIINF